MTKTIAKIILVVIIAFSMCMCLAACDLFFPDDNPPNNNNNKDTTVDIVVHNGSSSKNYTVTVGQVAKIDAVYKNDYYPLGFFDAEEGGKKYFDFAGDSISPWQEDYPKEFYAQFDSIENFEEIIWDFGSAEKSCKYGYYEPALDANSQGYYALMGNLDKTLEIRVSFRLMMTNTNNSTHYMYFYNKTENTREEFAKSPSFITEKGGTWYDFEFTLECSAKIFSDDMKIAIRITSSNDGMSSTYAKEFVMSVKFVTEQ